MSLLPKNYKIDGVECDAAELANRACDEGFEPCKKNHAPEDFARHLACQGHVVYVAGIPGPIAPVCGCPGCLEKAEPNTTVPIQRKYVEPYVTLTEKGERLSRKLQFEKKFLKNQTDREALRRKDFYQNEKTAPLIPIGTHLKGDPKRPAGDGMDVGAFLDFLKASQVLGRAEIVIQCRMGAEQGQEFFTIRKITAPDRETLIIKVE